MVGHIVEIRADMCNEMDIGQCQEEGELTNKDIGENLDEVLFG
jgi:hypothetical protein